MNEWEAKYKALLMGIDNPDYIENANKLVKAAVEMSQTTTCPFDRCFYSICQVVSFQQMRDSVALLPEPNFFARLRFAWRYLWKQYSSFKPFKRVAT